MRRPILPVVLVLLLLGLGGTALRSWTVGYPLVPRITEEVWRARLTIHWDPAQAPVRVAIPDFERHFAVIDGASDLFLELWGPVNGQHARSAVGMSGLPRRIAVEINGEFELYA